MARALAIVVIFAVAGLFGWAVPLARFFDAFQPMITALSIMIAAVFVRLNRGMPSLEWKSVDPEERKQLTARIVALTKEYGWIIGTNAVALLSLVTMSVVGKAEVAAFWPAWIQRLVAGSIGGIVALCITRMAYVVWRDIDVVRLQKHLIDALATREAVDAEKKRADETVASIRSAGVRKVEVAPPKAWDD